MPEFDNIAAFLAGRKTPIPDDIERAIVTPHEHEGPKNLPLWLIWKVQKPMTDGMPWFPQLDCVADTPESARYHVVAVLESHPGATVSVERIPANHRFASSLDDMQNDAHRKMFKHRMRKLDGD